MIAVLPLRVFGRKIRELRPRADSPEEKEIRAALASCRQAHRSKGIIDSGPVLAWGDKT